jgi:putative mycofactocin binding protein MftB
MLKTKYKLARGSQVRGEDFGLLFYRMNGPKLYFISSRDLILPDFFQGDVTLEEWIEKNKVNNIDVADISELTKILARLTEKGVIVEC